MKNHMLIDHEYVNCPLRFDDRIRPTNLLPIHMTVIFGNVHQPEFVYHGSSPLKSVKLISAMKAQFADVFPDELLGLPPAREIEFGIELIPDVEPISKAPYCMAPVELRMSRNESFENRNEEWVSALILTLPSVFGSVFIHPVMHRRKSVWMLSNVYEVLVLLWASMRISPNSSNSRQIKKLTGTTVMFVGYCSEFEDEELNVLGLRASSVPNEFNVPFRFRKRSWRVLRLALPLQLSHVHDVIHCSSFEGKPLTSFARRNLDPFDQFT
ncbi:hypothetical protein Tco_1091672 [Tanacetum coccineum]|uniref:Uncharacterized protein n=1 Tax=Tanacetum coccineum TaxID=301880 RepID=A0ABQ5I8X0_9ASTR